MAVTSLKRKKLKNRLRSKKRTNSIKQLTVRPAIKKVDVEEIKATFSTKGSASKKTAKDTEKTAKDTE